VALARKQWRSGVSTVIAAMAVIPNGALAAGYGVRELSAPAMGGAYAGAAALDDAPSYMGYNPAAAAGVDDWDAEGGIIAVWPSSEATVATARTGSGVAIGGAARQNGYVDPAYVPNLSARYRLSPQWSVGLSVGAPWGLSTTYDLGWAGRYHAHETKLLTVNASAAVAFQVSEELVLASALQTQYATGRLSNAIDIGTIGAAFAVPGALPTLQDGYGAFDAQDWGFGYSAGALWSPDDWLRIGASYRSEIRHRMTGPVSFSTGTSATGTALAGLGLLQDTRGATDLTTPSVVSLAAVARLSPQWSLSGEVAYTDWSVFRELRVEFANPLQPDEVTVFDWHDSWFGAIGAAYRAEEDVVLRFGVAFDQSPAGAARNARIPDADRTSVNAGVDIGLSDDAVLSLSVAHVFVDRAPINLSAAMSGNVFRGDLAAVSEVEATAVGIELRWR
jgi:long-chain fatty acid transport protein